MKKAVIDIGTNSVKLIIGERSHGNAIKIILDVNVITKLGEGMRKDGRLSEAAMARTAQAVVKFADFARSQGAEDVVCVGTMALRTAENAGDFIEKVRAADGPEVRVLSGEEEAALSSRAVLNSIDGALRGEALIFDTGGGSTEFVRAAGGEIERAFSVPVGAVTLTDENFKSSPSDPRLVCSVIEAGVRPGAAMMIGAGGNVTAIASAAAGLDRYDPNVIHGSALTREEIMRQTALYAKCTDEERREIKGLSPKRADIILGGACIILAAMEAAGAKEIVVSDRSLRHELLRRELSTDTKS
ncbi:MAG: Ppx/GppA family phosphatase [Cloacibacillus porcorum]|nr:Ppx/GppA family phosphatase [Cloacibacillus porcorum]